MPTPIRRTPQAPVPVRRATPVDRDGDGVPDRYDAAPRNARNRGWNERASQEYGAFVQTQIRELMRRGVEVDCADLACKLLFDFCKSTGLPNPLASSGGRWQTYTEARTGGLPNVHGENLVFTQVGADNLAKTYTRRVNDANGNGVAGYDDATGQVDVGDLRPGDMLFYDWDANGKVNHTVNVVDVQPDGRVTIAYGTYENLNKAVTPVTWDNLDLSTIQQVELTPGTPDYDKWFGPDNHLWGVRRFSPAADLASGPVIPYAPTPPPPPPPVVVPPPPVVILPPPPKPKPAPKKHGWLYFLIKPWEIRKLT
ncbi:MAG: cell wall hydrolase [Cyanobacteria bacterium RYN_339]|nr:cell wall hydrolase [Cyanobacteria bacterium RYN_339]